LGVRFIRSTPWLRKEVLTELCRKGLAHDVTLDHVRSIIRLGGMSWNFD
jgi:hypothetical protein